MDAAISKSFAESETKIDPKAEKGFLGAFDALAPKLYRFSVLRVGSKQLAEDMVSESFLKTWQYLGRGGEIRSYPVFLYKVLKNLMADHWRKRHTSSEIPIDEILEETLAAPGDLLRDIAQEFEVSAILAGFEKLSSGEREILHWRFVDGLSTSEIVQLSGKKSNAIYVSIYRSVRKLRKMLK